MLTAARALVRGCAGAVARRVTASSVRILMYHRFGERGAFRRHAAADFESQLRYLAKRFRPRKLGDIASALRQGRHLEPLTVAVTIDDGYADFVEYAYPLLQRYEIPATVFVVTRFLDGGFWLWFDAIHHLVHATTSASARIEIDGVRLELSLSSTAERNRAWETVADECLRLGATGRAQVLADLQDVLQVPLPAAPTADYAAMTWRDARRMDPSLIEFGSHTLSHPVLSQCATAEAEREIAESRRVAGTRLRRPVHTFCYPNGQPMDYDERTIGLVERAGYACATVAHGGCVARRADLFRLPRLSGATADLSQFRSAVTGLRDLKREWAAW